VTRLNAISRWLPCSSERPPWRLSRASPYAGLTAWPATALRYARSALPQHEVVGWGFVMAVPSREDIPEQTRLYSRRWGSSCTTLPPWRGCWQARCGGSPKFRSQSPKPSCQGCVWRVRAA
jgi:hypothetical protein